jgi:tetrahydromethanopterin S-methyltransferase subunit G
MQKEDKIPLLTRKSEQQKMEIRKNNIEKKIELIPELKAILASAKPLQV